MYVLKTQPNKKLNVFIMKAFTMQNEVSNSKPSTCDYVNVKNVRLIISLTGKMHLKYADH